MSETMFRCECGYEGVGTDFFYNRGDTYCPKCKKEVPRLEALPASEERRALTAAQVSQGISEMQGGPPSALTIRAIVRQELDRRPPPDHARERYVAACVAAFEQFEDAYNVTWGRKWNELHNIAQQARVDYLAAQAEKGSK